MKTTTVTTTIAGSLVAGAITAALDASGDGGVGFSWQTALSLSAILLGFQFCVLNALLLARRRAERALEEPPSPRAVTLTVLVTAGVLSVSVGVTVGSVAAGLTIFAALSAGLVPEAIRPGGDARRSAA